MSGVSADGVPVAAGGGDQAAGALGVGVDRPGPLSVVLGTSGVVFAALEPFAADPQARVHAFCHAVPGAWHAMGVMLSAAGSLRWLRDTVAPGVGYDELTREAAAWPPGTEGLLFLPYLVGERTPHADPDARGAFTGLSIRHDRGALVRAVLEGVAFALRDSLDLIGELGATPAFGRVSGGGARSEEWLRIVASVLELPLERVAVDEGAAFGAAILGGVAAGVWPRRRRRRTGDGQPGLAHRAGARVGRGLPRAAGEVPGAVPGAEGGRVGRLSPVCLGGRRPTAEVTARGERGIVTSAGRQDQAVGEGLEGWSAHRALGPVTHTPGGSACITCKRPPRAPSDCT